MVGTDDLSGVTLNLVETLDDALECKRWLGERRPVLGVDTETGGLDWWRDPLRTIQLGDALTGWCIPVEWKGLAQELLRDYDAPMVMHNAKFDAHFLETNGVTFDRRHLHDTRPMAHLIDALKSTGLKPLSARLIHPKATAGEYALKTAMKESGWTWATIPATFGPYWQYAALDPVLTARLYEKFMPQIQASYREAYELEMASTLVLATMERHGVKVDLGYCRAMASKIEPYLEEMNSWVRAEFGIENPNSDLQCIAFLNAQGIHWSKKTKKGNVAFDKEVLKDLTGRHPVIGALREMRDKSKLLKTYLLKYIELADSNQFIHPQTNPLGARTGRMSISRPSMQNLPRSQHPRNAIIPSEEGGRLGLIDFDQIEMRLLAHFAREERMIEAIKYGDQMAEAGHSGYDVHSMNARGIYGIPVDQPVPKKQRQVTKNSGFAIIYGAGEDQFAKTAGITAAEAKAFLAQYAATYPGVIQFQGEVGRMGATRLSREGAPYVVAPSGRRHVAERDKIYALVNYLIQGTAADVLKRKIVELDHAGLTEHLVLPVHDELIFDFPADVDADAYMLDVQKIMTDKSFSVPLTADVEVTDRWGTKYLGENEDPWLSPDLQEIEDKGWTE